MRELLADELQLDSLDADADGGGGGGGAKLFGLDLKTLRSGVVVRCRVALCHVTDAKRRGGGRCSRSV